MSTTGVVLLHGKWDAPPFAVTPLADALNDAGHHTAMSTYPWALRRLYDRPLEEAMATIDADVACLRESGCERIVVCGHSLGAAVALAHAAQGAAADGLVLLAPGHFPERMAADGHTLAALAIAQTQPAGDERIPLTDTFQGTTRRMRMRPAHYLSYFDPVGALVWPDNMGRLDANLPLLWVVGDKDPAAGLGIDYAFTRKRRHPLDRHVCLPARHEETPAAAITVVTDWLKRLEETA